MPVERIPVEATAGLPWPPATVADLLANPVSPSDPDSAGRIFALDLTPPEATWPITGPSRP
ncbi:hypothetical protein FNH05_31125 [Amycolatopsis rhizosphaerae]|uniref:Uncharacterized protein n=1 Tax=Amycolatopsis rhizosphaerae TaxID=2053003 RepID=A0A558ARE9_9PSEU|nr:hypothetical protein [Amycolatopsis rhizosphaerae]TVT26843.1 hypothetical protein FNH05_31125 [Amycolatopsis rhizosphaerae]